MANLGAVLTTSQYLTPADYLSSPSGLFFAIMQADGNFCVYHGSGPTDNGGLQWSTGTTQSGGEFFAIMQADGNFVVYAGSGPSNNLGFVWSSSSKSQAQGSYFAIVQDDGNFCVYRGTGPDDNQGLVWNSGLPDTTGNWTTAELSGGQIKLVNIANQDVVSTANITDLKYDARFKIMYWNVEFADVLVHKEDSTYVGSPSVSATLTAASVAESPISVGYGIKDITTVQNIGAVTESNGALKLYSGAGPTTPDMLTLTNQCSFPVTFVLAPVGVPAQTWTIQPNESVSVANGGVFTAYARVHSYPYEPIGSDGYDTPLVTFNTPTTTLKVAPNNSKGESYHIDVG